MLYALYHVTYANRLESIGAEGLDPDAQGAIGQGPGYDKHSTGRVFLTDADGVFFWAQKAFDWAQHNSDDPVSEGLVPVVLRVEVEKNLLSIDELGAKDSRHDAFYTTELIEPDHVSVWDGEDWVSADAELDTDLGATEDDSDDEERIILLGPDESGLIPEDLEAAEIDLEEEDEELEDEDWSDDDEF